MGIRIQPRDLEVPDEEPFLHDRLDREQIPRYEDHDWDEQRERLADNRADSSIVLDRPVFQFYQAAAAHRVYVLRDLLPEHGLIGD